MNMVFVIHWKVLKIDKGWFFVNQLEIHLIWENMMMQHSCQGLEYEELEKKSVKAWCYRNKLMHYHDFL